MTPMWYAVYYTATGALYSVGTVISEELAPGLSSVQLGRAEPDQATQQWNPVSHAFETKPIQPPESWTRYEFKNRFTLAERTAIREKSEMDIVVEDVRDLLRDLDEVRRDNPQVSQALAYLEEIGVLAPGRAAEILGG